MASVAFTGVATLVIRFSAPALPTEIVFSSSAKELKPIAVAFIAVAWLPTPNTLLRSAVAVTPAPIATELTPVAAAVSDAVKLASSILLSAFWSYQPAKAIAPFLLAVAPVPNALLTTPDALFFEPTAVAPAPVTLFAAPKALAVDKPKPSLIKGSVPDTP